MTTNHKDFFLIETPALIQNLKPDAQPLWGSMHAQQMLAHLYGSAVLMQTRQVGKLLIPEEKVPAAQAFLMSDKTLMKHAQKPEAYNLIEDKLDQDFELMRQMFVAAIVTFEETTRTESEDFRFFHPYFGDLNAEQTRQLQYKHIRHHFLQFALI